MVEINEFQYEQTHDQKLRESVCVAAIVKVIAFDKKKMTVNVQPISKHLEHGKYESQPPILRVPVMCMKTGGFIVRPWVNAGDVGIVVYLDHDMDSTVSGGREAEPRTERNHATSDAVFIGGIVSGSYSVPDIPDNAHVIAKEDGTLFVAVADSTITVKNGGTSAEFTDSVIEMKSEVINILASDSVNIKGAINLSSSGAVNIQGAVVNINE